jgi:hypothetical protein
MMTQGDLMPWTIAIPRRRCPRRTSRWASLTLIIVIVGIVNVGATLPPSDGVHGVCHGATAGRGASDDANFGRSGSLRMPPHYLRLPFCHPAGAAIPGEEEDDVQLVVAALHHCGGVVPTNQRRPHRKVFSFIFNDVDGGLVLLSSIVVVVRG